MEDILVLDNDLVIDLPENKLRAEVGWDAKKHQPIKGKLESMMHGISHQAYDLNISAVLSYTDGRRPELIFFGHKNDKARAVVYKGDNRTGHGDGVNEMIFMDLIELPPEASKVTLMHTIYHGQALGHRFGHVRNIFLQVRGDHLEKTYLREDKLFTEGASHYCALVFGTVNRTEKGWQLKGQTRLSLDNSEMELVEAIRDTL